MDEGLLNIYTYTKNREDIKNVHTIYYLYL